MTPTRQAFDSAMPLPPVKPAFYYLARALGLLAARWAPTIQTSARRQSGSRATSALQGIGASLLPATPCRRPPTGDGYLRHLLDNCPATANAHLSWTRTWTTSWATCMRSRARSTALEDVDPDSDLCRCWQLPGRGPNDGQDLILDCDDGCLDSAWGRLRFARRRG